MSDQETTNQRKFYSASGSARLIVLGDDPLDAAIEIVGRLMDDRLEGMFGKWIFVSEQGFRGDDWAGAHNDTRAFSSWEILITLGRLEGISYQRFLTIFRRSENDQSES
jgi:hypothetical protein